MVMVIAGWGAVRCLVLSAIVSAGAYELIIVQLSTFSRQFCCWSLFVFLCFNFGANIRVHRWGPTAMSFL